MAQTPESVSSNAAVIAAHVLASQFARGLDAGSVNDEVLASIASVAVRLAKALDTEAGA